MDFEALLRLLLEEGSRMVPLDLPTLTILNRSVPP
jgi:hypothetical protein